MGLDMYMRAKRYISENFVDGDKDRGQTIQNLFPELESFSDRWERGSVVKQVEVEVGYWRKANAIHKWFVDNVQGGTDDCGSYSVDREQLKELRTLCQSVLDDTTLAPELLPAQSGFFFGSTTYDEHYFFDIEDTIKQVDAALALPDSWDFEYHSSW